MFSLRIIKLLTPRWTKDKLFKLQFAIFIMGWFDTKNKRQNVIVTANAWDMQRIEERKRKRKWFIFLDIILVICILIGIIFIYYNQDYKTGIIFLVIGLLIFIYLFSKKRRRKNNNFRRQ